LAAHAAYRPQSQTTVPFETTPDDEPVIDLDEEALQ
jgi:hypothetical protein